MFSLIKKAKWIFLIVLAVYIISYGSGFVAGKKEWVDYQKLLQTKTAKLSRNLEKYVPGYGSLLDWYKKWHNSLRDKYLQSRNHWGMRILIFLNNWIAANLTMMIRAVFVLPAGLAIFGKFFQGAVFAQTPSSVHIWITFLTEFGGYYLTTCATLCMVFFTIFFKGFGFVTRFVAFKGGLKLILLAFAISAVSMAVGSLVETDFIMDLYSKFQ